MKRDGVVVKLCASDGGISKSRLALVSQDGDPEEPKWLPEHHVG